MIPREYQVLEGDYETITQWLKTPEHAGWEIVSATPVLVEGHYFKWGVIVSREVKRVPGPPAVGGVRPATRPPGY